MTGRTLKESRIMLQNSCKISTKEEKGRNCHLFRNERSVHTEKSKHGYFSSKLVPCLNLHLFYSYIRQVCKFSGVQLNRWSKSTLSSLLNCELITIQQQPLQCWCSSSAIFIDTEEWFSLPLTQVQITLRSWLQVSSNLHCRYNFNHRPPQNFNLEERKEMARKDR